LAVALLVCAAGAQAQVETPITATSSGGRWSYNTGETVAPNQRAAIVEAGWPGITFGYTMGLSDTTDIGGRLDLLYGVENTTNTHFGLGLRVPYRMMLSRNGPMSVMAHVDPGIVLYTTSSATFGFQAPVGVSVGYALDERLRVEAGVDFPLALWVSPSVDVVFGPLMGGGAEYRVDKNLTVGVDLRFGPIFAPSFRDFGTSLGVRALVTAAYRL
jgi:hypothetical protein